ncbi:T9SS type A sorting domain-containing protein [Pedobacter cryophilus]|uniref:T9SS type A sorting domain-containing protein n=1 Tax=Pedobacter cryophilus TaxID=2571271 RepID=A0A4U1C0T6_9SPHI|nr:T9SS type A sorting domain-containing protein [Pedobacter cryophilus]TKB99198.1 T9SS type A sorting domain-containing protein [Pedobacter cryophilus]
MKTKYLSIIILLFTINNVMAQGTWTGESNLPFNYDFNAGTGSGTTYTAGASSKSSVSSQSTPGFLSYPASGFARVYTAATGGGGFSVGSSPASLTITASNAAAGNKFSIYNVASLSAVTSTFFNLSFNNTDATTGALIYVFGNSATSTEGDNIFNNGTSLGSSTTAGIFNFLRWDLSATNGITLSYRNTGGTAFTTINSSTFTKTGGTYAVELYANNSANSQIYTRNAVEYTLPSGTFNIWVNSARITGSASLVNFPATGELAIGQLLNSAMMQASRSTTGTLLPATIGNISMKYISQSTLPISLSSFNVKSNEMSALLSWTTASEKDNAYFDIMRATGKSADFTKIGRVSGNGTSQKLNYYSFTDFNPLAGTNYYMLKQMDVDGKSSDSDVRYVTITGNEVFSILKLDGKLNLSVSSEKEEIGKIVIMDLSGKKVLDRSLSLNVGINTFDYDSSNLKEGIYLAFVTRNGATKSMKFIY